MTTTLFDLKVKTAIVTSGNGGIGLGIARGLAKAGADIAVVERNGAKSKAAADELAARRGPRLFDHGLNRLRAKQKAPAMPGLQVRENP